MATEQTPHYYMNEDGTDMYDTFLHDYGHEAVLAHMAMEIRQYRKRAAHKGQYATDMKKIEIIKDRMVAIMHDMYLLDSQQTTFPFNSTTI